jgi:hypothetical protein
LRRKARARCLGCKFALLDESLHLDVLWTSYYPNSLAERRVSRFHELHRIQNTNAIRGNLAQTRDQRVLHSGMDQHFQLAQCGHIVENQVAQAPPIDAT